MTGMLTTRADAARAIAETLLGDMGDRWRHTAGVASRAADLAGWLGLDPDILVSAAWLHDIGYAKPIAHTGFHPVDGAVHLTAEGWPGRIAGLVAYHSGARFVAEVKGFTGQLAVFADERSLMADALTYADQTTSPRGERVGTEQRYAEMLHRHGPCSANALADAARGPHLRAIATRVESLLRSPFPTPA
ncbi:HDIG domain-containing metalloprotein [Actinoplanes sp. GCM10030250]|uniref:HDIG domain-containing metalloprotein n=1 Tax=Actinoplanes sp. GCM10030250 TaxID=3273376 RepID=UPI003608EA2E